MSRPVYYEFPLTDILRRYNAFALTAAIEKYVGVRPIGITKHFRNGKIIVFFSRELSDEEKKKLVEVLNNPPTLFIVSVEQESEEEVKKRIGQKLGVEPARVVLDRGRVVQMVFDRPVDLSKLSARDLRVKRKIVLRPSIEE